MIISEVEIGMFYGREGSISYNIKERDGMTLIEGSYCIIVLHNDFDVEKLIDTKSGERYSLQIIEEVLSPLGFLSGGTFQGMGKIRRESP